jgi:hypothetical protein
MVEVLNRGETLTGIHYEGSNAMGESGAWVFAETSSGDGNIHCSDNITSSAYYTGAELAYRPSYPCGLADLNWNWNETVQDDFGVQVDVFHFVSLHEDYSCGDRSDLYFMELWVR